jgi:glycosyltransferase involved in cell wall biosynthesis
VTAFDYAAAHEFIRNGENGLVAPVGDDAAFIAQAVRLATEPELTARLRRRAAEAVRNKSWDAIVERFLADLHEAIEEHHAAKGTTIPLNPAPAHNPIT